MLLTVPIPTATYSVGSASIPEAPVPNGAVELVMTFDVTSWTNPASVLSMTMECSTDSKATWISAGAATLQCGADGTFRGKNNAVLTAVLSKFSWPSGVTHVRGTVAISGAGIQTGGTVTVN